MVHALVFRSEWEKVGTENVGMGWVGLGGMKRIFDVFNWWRGQGTHKATSLA